MNFLMGAGEYNRKHNAIGSRPPSPVQRMEKVGLLEIVVTDVFSRIVMATWQVSSTFVATYNLGPKWTEQYMQ